jgi:2-phospho-L-lactate guanylyltransferase
LSEVWALVPFKGFIRAKSRLIAELGPLDRSMLALAMARDVSTALIYSRTVTRVLLVSDVPALDRLIDVEGVELFDTGRACGLNEDLAIAVNWCGTHGAAQVLIVHADLPWITPAAVDRFVLGAAPSSASSMCVAACKDGSGTNLLLAAVPLPVPLLYGCQSLMRFRQAAAESGVDITVVNDESLAADIDVPDDLATLSSACVAGAPIGHATAAFMRLIGSSDNARKRKARPPGQCCDTRRLTTTPTCHK